MRSHSDVGRLDAVRERYFAISVERRLKHPAVVAWQTDNEYGCHDTVVSFTHGRAALDAFGL